MNRTWRVRALLLGACFVGITAYSAINTPIGSGTMNHSDLIGGPATVLMRTLTIAPNEVLGWHYHPGAGAYTIVTQGTLVVEDGCGGDTVYPQGSAFLEPPLRVHRGKNLTSGTVVTAQTFIVPLGSNTTESTGMQLCGAPIDVQECKGGGWRTFNHPRPFVSQGDCMQYVITGK